MLASGSLFLYPSLAEDSHLHLVTRIQNGDIITVTLTIINHFLTKFKQVKIIEQRLSFKLAAKPSTQVFGDAHHI